MKSPTQPAAPTTTTPSPTDTLNQNPTLRYKLHVFLWDLLHFRSDPHSQARLNTVVDPWYLGFPYFTASERAQLLQTPTGPGRTLADEFAAFFAETLGARLDGRMRETGEYKVCTAHDIAPMIQSAFQVKTEKVARSKALRNLIRRYGVGLPPGKSWKGLG